MDELRLKSCEPCRAGTPPLTELKIRPLMEQLPGWLRSPEGHLQKDYQFRNFKEALVFVNIVGEIAETEGHHPDLLLAWGKVGVTLYTHKIKGLSDNDFILAAKIDHAYQTRPPSHAVSI